jgi:hypothetical protein
VRVRLPRSRFDRRPPAGAWVAALVAASAAARYAAARGIETPWIVPDEHVYAELGRSLWEHGTLELLGTPTRFYSLVHPALVGLPLTLGDAALGYELAKALCCLVMSLVAVPVYLWGRTLMPRPWAVSAAALALATPPLAYSGLLLTEVTFYPVLMLAAFALARAVERPTAARQLLFVAATALAAATRLQGAVLLAVAPSAVALDAALARRRPELRRWLPAAAGLAALAAAWVVWQLHDGPWQDLLGAYRAAGETDYDEATVVRFVVYHIADLLLFTLVLPPVAFALLLPRALLRTEPDPAVRAFLAVTAALVAWTVLEVGAFASVHVGHLADRNLFCVAPPLFLALALWLSRGAPMSDVAFAAAGVAAVALLVYLPVRDLVSLATLPNGLTLTPLFRIEEAFGSDLDAVVPLFAVLALSAFALVPTRALGWVPFALAVLLAAASAAASHLVAERAAIVREQTLPAERAWIDAAAAGDVAYLYDEGEVNWDSVWQTAFWNRRVAYVYDFLAAHVPGGMPQESVGPLEDGALVRANGSPLDHHYVVSRDSLVLRGSPVAQGGDLRLWRVLPPVRLARWLDGVNFHGLVAGSAVLRVYGCRGGTFRSTLRAGERDARVTIFVDERRVRSFVVPASRALPVAVALPAGRRRCTLELRASGPVTLEGKTSFVEPGG